MKWNWDLDIVTANTLMFLPCCTLSKPSFLTSLAVSVQYVKGLVGLSLLFQSAVVSLASSVLPLPSDATCIIVFHLLSPPVHKHIWWLVTLEWPYPFRVFDWMEMWMVVCRSGDEMKRVVLVADGHGYLVTGQHAGGGDSAPGRLLTPPSPFTVSLSQPLSLSVFPSLYPSLLVELAPQGSPPPWPQSEEALSGLTEDR